MITLRLSLLCTQMMDKISPNTTESMFPQAHAERTAFVRGIWNNVGIKVANGKILKNSAAMLVLWYRFVSIIKITSFLSYRIV